MSSTSASTMSKASTTRDNPKLASKIDTVSKATTIDTKATPKKIAPDERVPRSGSKVGAKKPAARADSRSGKGKGLKVSAKKPSKASSVKK